jgi:hypothetical protein
VVVIREWARTGRLAVPVTDPATSGALFD